MTERQSVIAEIRKRLPVAELAKDGGPAVAYAMRVLAVLHELATESFPDEYHVHTCACGAPVTDESVGHWQQGRIKELLDRLAAVEQALLELVDLLDRGVDTIADDTTPLYDLLHPDAQVLVARARALLEGSEQR